MHNTGCCCAGLGEPRMNKSCVPVLTLWDEGQTTNEHTHTHRCKIWRTRDVLGGDMGCPPKGLQTGQGAESSRNWWRREMNQTLGQRVGWAMRLAEGCLLLHKRHETFLVSCFSKVVLCPSLPTRKHRVLEVEYPFGITRVEPEPSCAVPVQALSYAVMVMSSWMRWENTVSWADRSNSHHWPRVHDAFLDSKISKALFLKKCQLTA